MSVAKKLRVVSAMGRALARPREPAYLILYVNNMCNLRCDMCLTWGRMQQRTNDLTLEEFTTLSRSFRNLVQLTLTGGEPTLNRDLPKIAEAFYRNSHVAKCTLITNGTLPDRAVEQVEEILDRCPDLDLMVTTSLDGLRKTHERVRGVAGCFDKACRCIDRLVELRDRAGRRDHLSVGVTSVVSKYNWEHTTELYEFVKDRFAVDSHAYLLARGSTKEPDAKDVPLEAYETMTDLLHREENRSGQYLSLPLRALANAMRSVVTRVAKHDEYVIPCVAGRKLVEVYSNGDVVPCEILADRRESLLGNVRDYDLDIVKLLGDKNARNIRDYIRKSKCRCTFECAIYASLAFNPLQYPRVLAGLLHQTKDHDGRDSAQSGTERRSPGVQPA